MKHLKAVTRTAPAKAQTQTTFEFIQCLFKDIMTDPMSVVSGFQNKFYTGGNCD